MTNVIKSESKVKKVFDELWSNENYTKKYNSSFYRIYSKFFSRYNSTSYLSKIALKELSRPFNKQILLETGCGKGNAAVYLSKLGVFQYLLDISKGALETTRINFKRNNGVLKNVKFLNASLFDIPLKKDSIDFLWNEGVMEHFSFQEQIVAFKEFSRVVKPGGKLVIIVPNSNSCIYMNAKKYAERNNVWEFGYEKPMSTLKHIVKHIPSLFIEEEYSKGFVSQFGFLRYYFYKWPILSKLFLMIFTILQVLVHPFNDLPGYYLVTVMRKK